jgi:hypothetical protein
MNDTATSPLAPCPHGTQPSLIVVEQPPWMPIAGLRYHNAAVGGKTSFLGIPAHVGVMTNAPPAVHEKKFLVCVNGPCEPCTWKMPIPGCAREVVAESALLVDLAVVQGVADAWNEWVKK